MIATICNYEPHIMLLVSTATGAYLIRYFNNFTFCTSSNFPMPLATSAHYLPLYIVWWTRNKGTISLPINQTVRRGHRIWTTKCCNIYITSTHYILCCYTDIRNSKCSNLYDIQMTSNARKLIVTYIPLASSKMYQTTNLESEWENMQIHHHCLPCW